MFPPHHHDGAVVARLYELLRKTESTLKAAEASKKAKEVEDAEKNASAPKL